MTNVIVFEHNHNRPWNAPDFSFISWHPSRNYIKIHNNVVCNTQNSLVDVVIVTKGYKREKFGVKLAIFCTQVNAIFKWRTAEVTLSSEYLTLKISKVMLLNHMKVTQPTLWGDSLYYHEKFVENFAYFHFSFFFSIHIWFLL